MLAATHVAWSVSGWVSVAAFVPADQQARVLALGVVPAAVTAAGVLSPDVDRLWSPGIGGLHHWRRHRGFTHRVWFASVLTVVLAALAAPFGVPGLLVAAGAAWGWWSHLTGDATFGRIKVRGRLVGLGWRVGTAWEKTFAAGLVVVPVVVWGAVLV